MAYGDLRNQVFVDFADFFALYGFSETTYRYDEKFFGNELLELANKESSIRFVRDRSQISIDLKGKHDHYFPIHLLLKEIGMTQPEQSRDKMPKLLFGYKELVPAWPRLAVLLAAK